MACIHNKAMAVALTVMVATILARPADAGNVEPARPPSGYHCTSEKCTKMPPEMNNNRRLKFEYMYNDDTWRITKSVVLRWRGWFRLH